MLYRSWWLISTFQVVCLGSVLRHLIFRCFTSNAGRDPAASAHTHKRTHFQHQSLYTRTSTAHANKRGPQAGEIAGASKGRPVSGDATPNVEAGDWAPRGGENSGHVPAIHRSCGLQCSHAHGSPR
ncbi:hypothetical protein V8C35DRAFT_287091 [Trichoderma chlorosporum]